MAINSPEERPTGHLGRRMRRKVLFMTDWTHIIQSSQSLHTCSPNPLACPQQLPSKLVRPFDVVAFAIKDQITVANYSRNAPRSQAFSIHRCRLSIPGGMGVLNSFAYPGCVVCSIKAMHAIRKFRYLGEGWISLGRGYRSYTPAT